MYNTFGNLFKFTTWGESHGEAIGCVVDGCPSKIPLTEQDIQKFLDRRRPGQKDKLVSERKETDQVKILSGVFEGKTTGTPISLIIYNEDASSRDYSEIKDKFRPGHADYTYHMKYGIRDYRGGGRSSARETAMRVAAGAIANKILESEGVSIKGYLISIGDKEINRKNLDLKEIDKNSFFSPDSKIVEKWTDYLSKIKEKGDSVGACIEVIVDGIPAGVGEPVYKKLNSEIASALMGINGAKAFEIGSGVEASKMLGSEHSDEMYIDKETGATKFTSNNNGGVLGGISTGQQIVTRLHMKPTSSISIEKKTIDVYGNEVPVATEGRHDPCIGIRAVPVAEAMISCIIADHLIMKRCYEKFFQCVCNE